jgi:protein-S-isoprenylcysteine O-methyltransferase Ste14
VTLKPAVFDHIRLPRNFILLHPAVGFGCVPAGLILLDRRLHLPRLPGGFCRSAGTVIVISSVALTSWAVLLLMFQGKGAPNPDHPPRILVEQGPYRYSRNPMVAGAFLGLLGMGLRVRSLLLLLYIPLLGLVAQLYHVRTEEPELVERFGQAYLDYRQRVPRWLPNLRWIRSPARR